MEMVRKNDKFNWAVVDLKVRPIKSTNQEERQFVYDLKKQVYSKYVEAYFGEWQEENQKKLFECFWKENEKNIQFILIKDEKVGFWNGKETNECTFEIGNICVKPAYQKRGIGTAILKKILMENKGKNIMLQCFKHNPAIKLYERMGFEKIEETNTHIVMKKTN